ncbi:MAG: redoxin domain-containing protein [Planctomycetales bacterium]|nr:redoxin domain-containing protein [Planctomycetales bacterium]
MNSAVGHVAPDFTLQDTFGKSHRSSDYRGRWILLVLHRHLS